MSTPTTSKCGCNQQHALDLHLRRRSRNQGIACFALQPTVRTQHKGCTIWGQSEVGIADARFPSPSDRPQSAGTRGDAPLTIQEGKAILQSLFSVAAESALGQDPQHIMQTTLLGSTTNTLSAAPHKRRHVPTGNASRLLRRQNQRQTSASAAVTSQEHFTH